MTRLIGAIDQGTSSSRFLLFSTETGELVTYHQVEVKKTYPNEGWVEQSPDEIFDSVKKCLETVAKKLPDLGFRVSDILSVGIANQRESTICWDKLTGKALYNSIVWLDNRTSDLVDAVVDHIPGRDINWLKGKTGLPISTYFSALKMRWLIENLPEVRLAIKENRALFGTVDSWLLWKLTNGKNHMTDVTNASRTLLMDLETLDWDPMLCDFFHIPMSVLAEIKPSSSNFGHIELGPLKGVAISGVIGDQNAALVGQRCLKLGQTKVTYGTGAFLMQNIGPGPLHGALKGVAKEARRTLLTTVAFKLGDQTAWYLLEGSIAIAGAAITWLRDNLELIDNYSEVETIARQDSSAGGVFFVPAFQGLYAPYWDANATGTIIGISQFSKKCHLVRATLEGVAFQTNDIISLMRGTEDIDDGAPNHGVRVDGGMSSNDLLCQILADFTGGRILRPRMTESTALGAAMIASYQHGLWDRFARGFKQRKISETCKPNGNTNGYIKNGSISVYDPDLADHHAPICGRHSIVPRKSLVINGLNGLNGKTPPACGDDDEYCDYDSSISTRPQTPLPIVLQQGPKAFVQQLVGKFLVRKNSVFNPPLNEPETFDDFGFEKTHNSMAISAPDETDDEDDLDIFEPQMDETSRLERVKTWRSAVSRSRKWIRIERQEQKRADYFRWSAIPFTFFILTSFGMCILSNCASSSA